MGRQKFSREIGVTSADVRTLTKRLELSGVKMARVLGISEDYMYSMQLGRREPGQLQQVIVRRVNWLLDHSKWLDRHREKFVADVMSFSEVYELLVYLFELDPNRP